MSISALLRTKAAHDLAMDDRIAQSPLRSVVVRRHTRNMEEDQEALAMQAIAVAQTLSLRAASSLLQEVIQFRLRLLDGLVELFGRQAVTPFPQADDGAEEALHLVSPSRTVSVDCRSRS